MDPHITTLGRFLSDLIRERKLNNSTLAHLAGVSESVIRNLLKHGIDSRAKDPDPRTLRAVADALRIDALMLFRLAGYIPPAADANSVRAEYLADVFDTLPPEKQDAVMGVLEAMSDSRRVKDVIQEMRSNAHNLMAGVDLETPGFTRIAANQLIVDYQMKVPEEVHLIPEEAQAFAWKWKSLPAEVRMRIRALIRHKLSLDYNPTMVDPEWRE